MHIWGTVLFTWATPCFRALSAGSWFCWTTDPGKPGCVVWQCLAGCVTRSCHWGAGQWGGSETTGLYWGFVLDLWALCRGDTPHTTLEWIVYHPVARWAALVCIRCRQMITCSHCFSVHQMITCSHCFSVHQTITCSHFQLQFMHIKWTQNELVIFSVLNILYTFPPLTVTLTTDFKFSPVWLLPVGCLLGRHNCIHPPRVWRVIFFLGHSCTAGQIIYIKKTCAYGRFWQARFLKPLKNACMHP